MLQTRIFSPLLLWNSALNNVRLVWCIEDSTLVKTRVASDVKSLDFLVRKGRIGMCRLKKIIINAPRKTKAAAGQQRGASGSAAPAADKPRCAIVCPKPSFP